jgi:hypothetical protein
VGDDCGDVSFSEASVAERMWVYEGFVPENEIGRESPRSWTQCEAVAGEAGGDKETGRATFDWPDDGSLVGRRVYVSGPGRLYSNFGETRERPVELCEGLTYGLAVGRRIDLPASLPELTSGRHSRYARSQVSEKGSPDAHPQPATILPGHRQEPTHVTE